MAEEPAAKNKPKRRLRTAPQTLRERAEREAQKQEAKHEKVTRKLRKPKPEKAPKKKRKIFAPFRALWRPIRWLGKHIIPGYFKSAFRELRQTTWPDRKQSRQLTLAVIIFSVVFGAFVSALDYGLERLFKIIFVK